jgi:Cu/Ag efflux pump CusA
MLLVEKKNTEQIILLKVFFYVNDYDQMMRNLPQLSKYLVAENPDIMIYVDSFNTGPPIFADISYKIFGDDPFLLRSLGEELELIINNAPDISHTNSEASFSRTNIEIDFDSSNVSLSGKKYGYSCTTTLCCK